MQPRLSVFVLPAAAHLHQAPRWTFAAWAGAALAAVASPTAGQAQFTHPSPQTHQFLWSAPSGLKDGIAVDVDGDGDSDVVTASWAGPFQNRLYINQGSASFVDETALRLPAAADTAYEVAAADVDGDGDPDLVFAVTNEVGQSSAVPNRLYINDGNGFFSDESAARLPQIGNLSVSVATGDVDGDGDVDLVFANTTDNFLYIEDPQNRLYLNDGAGVFTDATAGHMPSDHPFTRVVRLVDVDGDDDLDLIAGNTSEDVFLYTARDQLFLNDGSGVFVDATSGRLPGGTWDGTGSIVTGDVDGDGDLDLVFGNYEDPRVNGTILNQVYVNDGSGVFSKAPSSQTGMTPDSTQDILLLDVNRDGALDIVVANVGDKRLYINDGLGTFTEESGRLPQGPGSLALIAGDLDLDDDRDLLALNTGADNDLLINDGAGTFYDVRKLRMPSVQYPSSSVVVGDVDADGDPDVVRSNVTNALLLNDGHGYFHEPEPGIEIARNTVQESILADADADGDLDLFLATVWGIELHLNDGAGTFTDASAGRVPPGQTWTLALGLGDVDDDGDADLVLGNNGVQNQLWLNDGAGFFTDVTATSLPPDTDATGAVVLGDVDGDGDLDVVFGERGGIGRPDRLLVNDGAGVFTDATGQLPALLAKTEALAAGDVDGDGDLDLVVGNVSGSSTSARNRLYLNDGAGTFSDASAGRFPLHEDATLDLLLIDLERDGDLDLFVGNAGQSRFYRNSGGGFFVNATEPVIGAPFSSGVLAAVDADGDGDPDLVTHTSLLLNRRRQLDAPLLARTGKPYRLDLFARDPVAPAGWALLSVSSPFASAARSVLPSGTGGTAARLVRIPESGRRASLTFTIPQQPSLVGTTIRALAVFFDLARVERPPERSNRVTDTIIH